MEKANVIQKVWISTPVVPRRYWQLKCVVIETSKEYHTDFPYYIYAIYKTIMKQ